MDAEILNLEPLAKPPIGGICKKLTHNQIWCGTYGSIIRILETEASDSP